MSETLVGRDTEKSLFTTILTLDRANETATIGALIMKSYTTAERDALTAVNGMIIYNSTLNKFQGYENGAWANLI